LTSKPLGLRSFEAMPRICALVLPVAVSLGLSACSPSAHGQAAQPASSPTSSPANAAQTAVGSQAPSFAATALDGSAVTLADYRGKVLVLNFWATWCPPCRAETPDMIRAFGKLGARDVAFLGIDTTETAPIVKSFVELEGVPYRIALGKPETYNAYGVAYIPTTVVIDSNGIVRGRWTGAVTPAQLSSYVASAREGKNSEYLTAEQQRLDKLLALSQFHFTGSRSSVKAEAVRAGGRLAQVDAAIAALGPSATRNTISSARSASEGNSSWRPHRRLRALPRPRNSGWRPTFCWAQPTGISIALPMPPPATAKP
jgi:peroxiredoxin